MVDVAVLRLVRGELGVVKVDLLHCVARQLLCSSRMPGSVTPSRRCSGSAASLSSCAARLAACSCVRSMTGAGSAASGSSGTGSSSADSSGISVTGVSSDTPTCAAGDEIRRSMSTLCSGNQTSAALCCTRWRCLRWRSCAKGAMWRHSWFKTALRTEVLGAWEMAALGSDAASLAAAGTIAPLSARPPSKDESLCSLLPLHPMFK